LSAERVPPNSDVDCSQVVLVGPTVGSIRREENHAGTRSERWHPGLQPAPQRTQQAGRLEQERHRGGFPTRKHEHVDALEIGRSPNL
jgi:hypothetical protein